MSTPTLQLLYNPGEYIPSPIAPEGVPTVADPAVTMEDLSPEAKALLKRNEQRVKERNQREYEEHRRKTDVRFTGEKPLQTEDHLFAGALVGGSGIKQGLRFLKSHPLLRAGLDIYGTGDGIVNLFTGDGVQKTLRLAKEGDTWGALKSGTGDVLNLLGAGDLIRIGSRFNRVNRTLHAFDAISPAGYDSVGKRTKQWIGDIINDKKVDIDNPSWNIDDLGKLTSEYLNRSASSLEAAKQISSQARFDAWRIYNGLPQKYGMYIPNGDGTLKYNLDKIMEIDPKFKPASAGRVDDITGSGGGLTMDDWRTIWQEDNTEWGVRTIEDTWDLHPFSRLEDQISLRLSKKIANPGSRPQIIARKLLSPLNKPMSKLEVGMITGGKPFKMHTEIPIKRTKTFINIDGISVPDYVTKIEESPVFDTHKFFKSFDELLPNFKNITIDNIVQKADWLNKTPIKSTKL